MNIGGAIEGADGPAKTIGGAHFSIGGATAPPKVYKLTPMDKGLVVRPPSVWLLIEIYVRYKNGRVGHDDNKLMIPEIKIFGPLVTSQARPKMIKWFSPITLEQSDLEQNDERHRVPLVKMLQNMYVLTPKGQSSFELRSPDLGVKLSHP